MKFLTLCRALLVPLLVGSGVAAQHPAASPWQEVADALGRAGEEKNGVYRVTFPRSDLRVRVAGVNLRAPLALTSWAAFQQSGHDAMMMGDLVLLAAEVQPVVSKLAAAGVQITAIHNHLLGEQPRVVYAHFEGHGKAAALASTLRSALALTATPLAAPRPRPGSETTALAAEHLARLLGHKAATRGGVVSFSVPRAEKITGGTPHVELGPRMGLATAINFQPEGSGAAIAGDFVLLAAEVQPVVRALREHGIEITAIHNHMLDEQPRLFFLHFWGRADAEKLAQGLRAALDLTNHAREQ